MTVLGRRKLPPGAPRRLDLTRVDLRGARLGGANLQGAVLEGANLQDAWLVADLQDAVLEGANLQGARANKDTRWPAGWTPETAKDRGVLYPPYPQGSRPD